MIDRARLKKSAKDTLQHRKASAYLVGAVYVGFAGLSDTLIYALTGYDVLISRLQNALSVSPELGLEDALAMAEPIGPVALAFIAAFVLYRIAARFCLKGFCLGLARGVNPGLSGFLDGLSLFLKAFFCFFLSSSSSFWVLYFLSRRASTSGTALGRPNTSCWIIPA